MQSKSWQRVDAKKGKYLVFKKLVEKEGGGESGLKAAKNIATKCALMGGKWLFADTMAENTKYLRIEHEYTEELCRRWELYEESVIKRGKAEPIAAGTPSGTPSGTPNGTPNAKRTKTEGDDTKPTPQKDPKPKNALVPLLVSTMKLNQEHQKVYSAAESMITQIKTIPRFGIFRGQRGEADTQGSLQGLEDDLARMKAYRSEFYFELATLPQKDHHDQKKSFLFLCGGNL